MTSPSMYRDHTSKSFGDIFFDYLDGGCKISQIHCYILAIPCMDLEVDLRITGLF